MSDHVTTYCGPDDDCVWRDAVGFPECPGCTRLAAPPVSAVRTDGHWQEKQGLNGDLLYRYRCDCCGHTGRWVKNGNLVEEAYEAHRYGGIDDGVSRCRRR